jgi:hypothetical protein
MRLAALIAAFLLVAVGCLLLLFEGLLALTFDPDPHHRRDADHEVGPPI